MYLPLLISTFTTVFLAELGDKTQLATVALSGSTNRPLAVFIGSSTALVLASLLGVIAGGSIAVMVPGSLLKLLSAIGLLIIGLRLLWPLFSVFSEKLTFFFYQLKKK
tara:strand:- start:4078 stop:4401 length:324 start_codon:yes stop_codon:yes gene_type:complete